MYGFSFHESRKAHFLKETSASRKSLYAARRAAPSAPGAPWPSAQRRCHPRLHRYAGAFSAISLPTARLTVKSARYAPACDRAREPAFSFAWVHGLATWIQPIDPPLGQQHYPASRSRSSESLAVLACAVAPLLCEHTALSRSIDQAATRSKPYQRVDTTQEEKGPSLGRLQRQCDYAVSILPTLIHNKMIFQVRRLVDSSIPANLFELRLVVLWKPCVTSHVLLNLSQIQSFDQGQHLTI
jgi:hypothetical protein